MNYLRPNERPWLKSRSRGIPVLSVVFAIAIIYASLYPLTGWRDSQEPVLDFLMQPWPRYWTGFDLSTNFIFYIPLGLTLSLWIVPRSIKNGFGAVLIVTTLCALLSLSLEILQHFMPHRVPAWPDIVANTLGAATGAVLGWYGFRPWLAKDEYRNWRNRWLKPNAIGAICLIGIWLALQALPQNILFELGVVPDSVRSWLSENLSESIGQVRLNQLNIVAAIFAEVITICVYLFVITTLVIEITDRDTPRAGIVIALVGIALGIKSLTPRLMAQAPDFYWLSVGAQTGLILGAVSALVATSLRRRLRLILAGLGLLLALIIANLAPVDSFHQSMMTNWRDGNYTTVVGVLRHVSVVWPWLALVYLVTRRKVSSRT